MAKGLLSGLLILPLAAPAAAQQDSPAATAEPTDPQPVELQTADGVLLRGVFFAAEKPSKETPVVVMLPDEGESPKVFDKLAMALQFGLADEKVTPMSVLAIALRGQGDSTRVRRPGGEVVDLRGARLKPDDAAAMVRADMEAVRRFLVAKNDAGELNLNRLAYLGVGAGSVVATNAAALDWEAPLLSQGKQGRDVKALVLVSPPWKWLGLDMLPALRQPGVQSEVAVLVTYGAELASASRDAERIVRELEKNRPAPAEPVEAAEGEEATEPEPPTLVDLPGESKLQGSAWMKQSGRRGRDELLRFLDQHLAQPEAPWVQRVLD